MLWLILPRLSFLCWRPYWFSVSCLSLNDILTDFSYSVSCTDTLTNSPYIIFLVLTFWLVLPVLFLLHWYSDWLSLCCLPRIDVLITSPHVVFLWITDILTHSPCKALIKGFLKMFERKWGEKRMELKCSMGNTKGAYDVVKSVPYRVLFLVLWRRYLVDIAIGDNYATGLTTLSSIPPFPHYTRASYLSVLVSLNISIMNAFKEPEQEWSSWICSGSRLAEALRQEDCITDDSKDTSLAMHTLLWVDIFIITFYFARILTAVCNPPPPFFAECLKPKDSAPVPHLTIWESKAENALHKATHLAVNSALPTAPHASRSAHQWTVVLCLLAALLHCHFEANTMSTRQTRSLTQRALPLFCAWAAWQFHLKQPNLSEISSEVCRIERRWERKGCWRGARRPQTYCVWSSSCGKDGDLLVKRLRMGAQTARLPDLWCRSARPLLPLHQAHLLGEVQAVGCTHGCRLWAPAADLRACIQQRLKLDKHRSNWNPDVSLGLDRQARI